MQKNHFKAGFYASCFLTLLTVITFALAMTAIPPSGPYCRANCMDYPFPGILLYYPRDYYWMYLAVFQLFAFVIFVASGHFIAQTARKLYSFLSVSFAIISSVVLLLAYFVQFSVVPVSVMNGETDGIALITQYNDHGVFIAMEELGYIAMSVALFFMGLGLSRDSVLERISRAIMTVQLFLTGAIFGYFAIQYGIERSYRFEVATIAINWLVIIITGILTSIQWKREWQRTR